MNETVIPMRIEGGEIQVKATLGQTVIKVVAPDEYTGSTEVTPSDQTQVLETKDKLVREDITVTGITGTQVITQNGEYDVVGDKLVTVDIPATGYDKGTLIYEGDFETTTSQFAVTALPDGSAFAFDKIEVEISNAGAGSNSGWRQFWRSDLPMTGNQPHMLGGGVRYLAGATALLIQTTVSIDGEYITLASIGFDADNPVKISADANRVRHGGYDKITAYAWWSWACPAGAHIKITGYNRTAT